MITLNDWKTREGFHWNVPGKVVWPQEYPGELLRKALDNIPKPEEPTDPLQEWITDWAKRHGLGTI